ncbi:hypothetical protein CK203_055412 [Vitis vinifera]|uniref:Uncharacterized protein n=1 Tax=Vitis vinifera TaxID=29760 RepID=A0A438HMZ0_VITVI|nr:hypothetical protein CK203_055412 [Vitis vinifera]
MLGDQVMLWGNLGPTTVHPYGNTYNSSWRNHPNFSWKPRPPPYQPQGQTQAPQQPSSVEQAIVNLSKVMGDFVGKVPLSTKPKSKGVHEVETQDGGHDEELMSKRPLIKESNNQEEKSGKKSASKSSIEEEPRIVIKEDMMKKHMPPPFPQALHGKKEIKNSSKFLKSETSEVKRGLQVTKNAFLTEQVSAIIQKWGDAAHIWKHDLELNIFHLCKRHLHPEEEEGLEEVCLINTLVEEHCDKNLEESLNESLEVLEEGLPEPSDVLAIMSPWRRRKRSYPWEAENRGYRAVQAVDLHISKEHGSHSITRDFWRYMPATWESLKIKSRRNSSSLIHLQHENTWFMVELSLFKD